MQSTHAGDYFPYLGVDLTSRYANSPKPIDVCGLSIVDKQTIMAHFWHWQWGLKNEPVQIDGLLTEIHNARIIMIDGPHALAKQGERVRNAEKALRTPGRTPCELPALNLPYSGFIHSSLELFSLLNAYGFTISSRNGLVSIFECYPAAAWKNLNPSTKFSKKSTQAGRSERCRLLNQLGVEWSQQSLLTHDQIDACICAVISAAMDDRLPNLQASTVGEPLYLDRFGKLREGPICTVHPSC